ncbi:AI-2E family transporter [Aestuariirhabdus sp. Z084]|uniref:AI-2E family transporter n=1 Tax=Aestuariirhabdus haliotis TaxID=2918751 RepID=UPI00201B3884|nr:AI-2E family transporter [Aestuariirhabdus haliotis]MCL6416295.1 AI-2E family transporter [Aestuariirhabdus haliotis]MCL6420168.1 AI-2E family transporter [Aestuariirhabdus haliotis]
MDAQGMTSSQRWFMLGTALVIGGLIYLLSPILAPFLVAMILAYLGDPIADRLEAKGWSRTWSVVVVFVVMTLLLLAVLLVVIPMLGAQLRYLITNLPEWIGFVEQHLVPLLQTKLGVEAESLQFSALISEVRDSWKGIGNLMVGGLVSVSKSGLVVIAWLANLLLIPVVAFYLLRDWDILMDKFSALLPINLQPVMRGLASECDEVLGAFLKGQMIVMICLGVIYSIGLWVVGLKLALVIGLLAGLASIVPYMGFIVGIGAALVAALFQFDGYLPLVWVGVVFMIGQALEGMVLTPMLVGDRIGLHPVAVIFAIMAGGQLFGFTGVLLALPIGAVIMVLLRHLHGHYRQSHFYHADISDQATDVPPANQSGTDV